MNLSRLHGGLTDVLGLPGLAGQAGMDGPNRQPLADSRPRSVSAAGLTAEMPAGSSGSTLEQPPRHHGGPQAQAVPHLRVFDSPAYASSDAGTSKASSSVQSSPGAPAALAASPQDGPFSRLSLQSINNGLYMDHTLG